jgi:hypothetical protein
MKPALVDGSRYGWRGALVFPGEYFDGGSGATYTLIADPGTYSLTGNNATLTYTPSGGGTVGDNTAGTDTSPASGDRAWLSQFAMPGAGDGVTGYLRFDATSGAGTNAKFLVYADNGSGQPGALLYASTGQAVPGGGGVLSWAVSVPGLTAAQLIWLGGVTDSFEAKFQVDTSGGQSRMEGTTYATPAGTWTQSGTGAGRMNAWMDYTSSGGGPTYTLTADPGAFTLTGNTANLVRARVMPAATGAYTLAGNAANLVRGRRLVADAGAYAFTGADVGLVYTSVGGYTLPADAGSFALTGGNANLVYGRVLSAAPGAYTFTGSAAGLRYARRLVADPGAYALVGYDATLTYSGGGPAPMDGHLVVIYRRRRRPRR